MLNNNKYKLSVGTGDIIAELVKKYGLGPVELLDNPEMEKALSKAKTPEQRLKIIKNLPYNKIFDIIEDIADGKFELKNLYSDIKKQITIPEQIAKDLAKDLEEQIFSLTKKQVDLEKEPVEQSVPVIEKQTDYSKKDIYRELVE